MVMVVSLLSLFPSPRRSRPCHQPHVVPPCIVSIITPTAMLVSSASSSVMTSLSQPQACPLCQAEYCVCMRCGHSRCPWYSRHRRPCNHKPPRPWSVSSLSMCHRRRHFLDLKSGLRSETAWMGMGLVVAAGVSQLPESPFDTFASPHPVCISVASTTNN